MPCIGRSLPRSSNAIAGLLRIIAQPGSGSLRRLFLDRTDGTRGNLRQGRPSSFDPTRQERATIRLAFGNASACVRILTSAADRALRKAARLLLSARQKGRMQETRPDPAFRFRRVRAQKTTVTADPLVVDAILPNS